MTTASPVSATQRDKLTHIGHDLFAKLELHYSDASSKVGSFGLAEGRSGFLLLSASFARAFTEAPMALTNADVLLGEILRHRSSDCSLFSGWAGVHVATMTAYGERAPKKPMSALQSLVDQAVFQSIPKPFTKLESIYGLDLISGLGGMLFAAGPDARTRIAEYFDWLSVDPTERLALQSRFEEDWYDVGLAHGIGGFISSLSLNLPNSLGDVAVRRLSNFVIGQAISTDSASLLFKRTPKAPTGDRVPVSWCYGGLGTSAALLAAGIKLHDQQLIDSAVNAAVTATAPANGDNYWIEPDLNLCHGTAGNALILASIAIRSNNPILQVRLQLAIDKLCESYDSSLPFGFKTLLADGSVGDSAGLLMGSLGIALALCALVEHESSSWMRLFGIPSLDERVLGQSNPL